ncbi:hypothetical protein ABMC89_18690 [Sulfitobacter sp. HNIBRBA3233]|uniref:hypothetical protein n=1 Tax=Sulfitobacter marinivivus TaxID=3158558 RepID=UPI0032DF3AB1
MTDNNYTRIVFANDFLRIDDTRPSERNNPQEVNIAWFRHLLGMVPQVINKPASILTPEKIDETRTSIFKRCGLIPSTDSWAKIYNQELDKSTKEQLADFLEGSLVLIFEAPKYLISMLEEYGIEYIDFTIHPIRFLPDYALGVRTNIDHFREKFQEIKIGTREISLHARLLKALSQRKILTASNAIPEGSVVFCGQTQVDASLINDGKLYDKVDIEIFLMELTNEFGNVYYKGHPHAHYKEWMTDVVSRNPKVKILERNIYDVLADDNFVLVSSISSSVLYEAQYFGRDVRTLSTREKPFTLMNEAAAKNQYIPIHPNCLEDSFWEYLLSNKIDSLPDATLHLSDGALKRSISMQWGR